MSARADLLRLTPEALAQLANVGLVKRAQRELGSGYAPALTIAADGRIDAVFPDGVRTAFAPGAGLKDATCSCGAAVCRHRIAVALHYAATAGGAEAVAPPVAAFASLDDAAVRAQTAATLWPAVERELKAGIRIEVDRTAGADGRSIVFTARLPSATARYYAGADLAFARCDCTAQQRCEHVALGALALRQAGELADARVAVELRSADAAPRAAAGFSAAPCRALLRLLLRDGLAHGAAEHPATAAALTAALADSRALGATWLTLCLEDIEQWLDLYQRRSARFAYRDGVGTLTELALRIAAADDGGGALAARTVLGIGEAMETALDRLALLSLGLRVHGDGSSRRAALAVVDADTQTLLRIDKRWERAPDAQDSELAALDQQRIAGSLRLLRLATGSLVTTTAKRRANGELRLGQSHAGRASIGAQNGDWSRLAAPLLIPSRADYLRRQQQAPPLALAARSALPGFHVLRVAAVAAIGFDPALQRLHADVADADGGLWRIEREHASATPGALDAIARTLRDADPAAVPLYIAGTVQRSAHGFSIDPWAISAGRIVVPDAAPADGALTRVDVAPAARAADDPLTAFVAAVDDCLGDLLRDGMVRHGRARARLAELCVHARERGLAGGGADIVARMQKLHDALGTLQSMDAAGHGAALDDATDAALAVAVWNGLAHHAMATIESQEAE